jgi:hypothetical protein
VAVRGASTAEAAGPNAASASTGPSAAASTVRNAAGSTALRGEPRGETRPPHRPPHPGPQPGRGPEPREARAVGAAPAAAGARIALFVDVEHLLVEARQLGGEVSYSRVLRNLAGQRTLVRAIAYVGEGHRSLLPSLQNGGFEVELVDDARGSAVALATDAVTVGPRVDCVVLAPESAAFGHLARALRARGVRVETAGFGRGGAERGRSIGQHHHQLGKECLFVP